jgi:hypothetical protein
MAGRDGDGIKPYPGAPIPAMSPESACPPTSPALMPTREWRLSLIKTSLWLSVFTLSLPNCHTSREGASAAGDSGSVTVAPCLSAWALLP